ncbi:MAG: hypothetical protein WB580_13325 [Candidatus Binataceae bacterium]
MLATAASLVKAPDGTVPCTFIDEPVAADVVVSSGDDWLADCEQPANELAVNPRMPSRTNFAASPFSVLPPRLM